MKAHLILPAVVALVLLGIPVSAPTWMVPSAGPAMDQSEGRAALDTFLRWRSGLAGPPLGFNATLDRYREKLKTDGVPDAVADRTIRLILAYDEAELYDSIYAAPPKFNTKPNQLLVDAVEGVRAGVALDIDMGQGRNALYLASKGWQVTGFDVSEVGVRKARQQAALLGLTIDAVHASDEEFDFGRNRWDLIPGRCRLTSMPGRAAGQHHALPQSRVGSRFFGRTLPPCSRW